MARRVVGSIAPVASLDSALLSLRRGTSSRVHGKLRMVDAAKGDLVSFIRSCHGFARVPAPRPALFCIRGFTRHVMGLTQRRAGFPGVAVGIDMRPSSLVICTSRGLVSRIILGLLGGTVRTVNYRRTSNLVRMGTCYGRRRTILVRIDGGKPIVPRRRTRRVFIPFFAAGRNNDNVKLSVSHRVVHLSKNDVTLGDTPTTGQAAFMLAFPWGKGGRPVGVVGCRGRFRRWVFCVFK